MTRAEAKLRVYQAVAVILSESDSNQWTDHDDNGIPLNERDAARVRAALADFVGELQRRSKKGGVRC